MRAVPNITREGEAEKLAAENLVASVDSLNLVNLGRRDGVGQGIHASSSIQPYSMSPAMTRSMYLTARRYTLLGISDIRSGTRTKS